MTCILVFCQRIAQKFFRVLPSCIFLVALLVSVGAPSAWPCATWTGGAFNNLWSTAANWNNAGVNMVPNAGTDACIDTISTAASPASVTLDMNGSARTLRVSAADTLFLPNTTLTVGSLNNVGHVVLQNGTINGPTLFNNGIVNDSRAFLHGSGIINSTILNNGQLSADGPLSLTGNVTGNGNVSVGGTLTLKNISVSASSVNIAPGGTLNGNGNVSVPDLSNNGLLSPFPGAITVNGNYTQGLNGTLDILLGGIAPGQSSLLGVSNIASLSGTLEFTASGFTPMSGDVFTFLLFGKKSGDFSNVVFDNGVCPLNDTCSVVVGPKSMSLDITPMSPSATPEPASILLFGTGLLGMALLLRKSLLT